MKPVMVNGVEQLKWKTKRDPSDVMQGWIWGGPGGPGPPTTKNEAPAPKFYKIEAPEWQF